MIYTLSFIQAYKTVNDDSERYEDRLANMSSKTGQFVTDTPHLWQKHIFHEWIKQFFTVIIIIYGEIVTGIKELIRNILHVKDIEKHIEVQLLLFFFS